jgi:hypothetical protein
MLFSWQILECLFIFLLHFALWWSINLNNSHTAEFLSCFKLENVFILPSDFIDCSNFRFRVIFLPQGQRYFFTWLLPSTGESGSHFFVGNILFTKGFSLYPYLKCE